MRPNYASLKQAKYCRCSIPQHCDRNHGTEEYPPQVLMTLQEQKDFWQKVNRHINPITNDKHADEFNAVAQRCYDEARRS
jgi:hypothetical protein